MKSAEAPGLRENRLELQYQGRHERAQGRRPGTGGVTWKEARPGGYCVKLHPRPTRLLHRELGLGVGGEAAYLGPAGSIRIQGIA